jgi:hypothetical protein
MLQNTDYIRTDKDEASAVRGHLPPKDTLVGAAAATGTAAGVGALLKVVTAGSAGAGVLLSGPWALARTTKLRTPWRDGRATRAVRAWQVLRTSMVDAIVNE